MLLQPDYILSVKNNFVSKIIPGSSLQYNSENTIAMCILLGTKIVSEVILPLYIWSDNLYKMHSVCMYTIRLSV